MCGRYVEVLEFVKVIGEFGHLLGHLGLEGLKSANFNTAPTDSVHVIMNTDPPTLKQVRWGLIPVWEQPPFKKGLHNVRSEAILKPWSQKPAYGNMLTKAIRTSRCIFLMSGFYEWEATEPPKQPWFIFDQKRPVFGVAGIYRTVVDHTTGEEITSAAIITQPANDLLLKVKHDRMPMILHKEEYDTWLAGSTPQATISHLMQRQFPPEKLNAFPISRFGRENHAGLITPIGQPIYENATIAVTKQLELQGMGGRRNKER